MSKRSRVVKRVYVLHVASVLSACVGSIERVDPVQIAPAENALAQAAAGRGSQGADRGQGRNTGEHLSGIDDAAFAAAKEGFVAVEGPEDGLGPVFNERACGTCHSLGGVGGAGTQIERRFGRFDDGRFNPLANAGGSLRQLQSLGTWTNPQGQVCQVPVESEPSNAAISGVGRLTTPLFGLGLVDAMPDAFFQDLAKSQPAQVRGTVSLVRVLLPDPRDASQSLGSQRVGRFGWKASVANLVQFAADAYLNEMGITTQHCIRGQSVDSFATESAPNGTPIAAACEDGKPGVDDSVGPCTNNLTEIQDDVAAFNQFMTFLPPPGRAKDDSDLDASDEMAPAGRRFFDKTGCADCHVRKAFQTPQQPANGVAGKLKFRPFSDFLLHDMGALGDQIGNAGDSKATTRMMRTAPLWGIRFRTLLLHDGRARDIASAIAAHDGQGRAAADAFAGLSASDKNLLVQFVSSL